MIPHEVGRNLTRSPSHGVSAEQPHLCCQPPATRLNASVVVYWHVMLTLEVYQLLLTKIAKMPLRATLPRLLITTSYFKSNHNVSIEYYINKHPCISSKIYTVSVIHHFSSKIHRWVKWLNLTRILTRILTPSFHRLFTYFLLCEFVIRYNGESTNILTRSSCLMNPWYFFHWLTTDDNSILSIFPKCLSMNSVVPEGSHSSISSTSSSLIRWTAHRT